MTVKFTQDETAKALIGQIADRYGSMDVGGPLNRIDRLELEMDLSATHANGCPMDFERLLAASNFDFMHDVSGINACIDRETGGLRRCFLPRFSVRRQEG